MKALLITANDPLDPTGGGQRTIRQQLANVSREGHEVEVLTYGEQAEETDVGEFSVRRTPETAPESLVGEYVGRDDVDVVVGQSGWADLALRAADRRGAPFVLDAASTFDLTIDSGVAAGLEPDRIVVPSEFLEAEARAEFDCPVTVANPIIDFDYYGVDDQTREAHAMINPIESKGGFVFEELAERNPERSFLTKMGWFLFRDDDLSWDPEMFEIIARTFPGETPMPDEPTFEDVPNVEFVRRGDIRDIYRRTRVLLVPSLGTESFGRVVVEAMWNGIPVVASDHGGIPEAASDAAILVDDYEDVDAWERALARLDDESVYQRLAEAGRERAERYRRRQPEMLDRYRRALEAAA